MSHMDDRFRKFAAETVAEDLGIKTFSELSDYFQKAFGLLDAKGCSQPEPIRNVYTVAIPRINERGAIEARVFIPEGEGPHPGILYLHGGGFCTRNFCEPLFQRICKSANAVVVAPKYRLAPEHKFPAGPNDCLDTYKWLAENSKSLNVDQSRLFLTGESAGGNLAATLAMRIRDENIQPTPAGQMPVMPFLSPKANASSYVHMGRGLHWVTREVNLAFWEQYQSDPSDINNPIFTVFATSNYENLPPALILVGGADPLLDDGVILGAHLKEAGVDSTTVTFADMPHMFNQWDRVFPTESSIAIAIMAQFVKTIGKRVKAKL